MRLMLICCEGKTEKLYFDILAQRVLRLPGFFNIEIIGERRQHRALVDRTVEERKRLAEEYDVDEASVESWAVCDDDGMRCSYAELLSYAEAYDVGLAFSRPQFESYLLQHFEQSKAVKKSELFAALSRHRRRVDGKDHNEKTKADLEWLEAVLVDKPKLVRTAIVNADQRSLQSTSPFLTVQRLTERLLNLQRW